MSRIWPWSGSAPLHALRGSVVDRMVLTKSARGMMLRCMPNPLMQRPPGVLRDGAIPWPPAALVWAGNDCANPLPRRWQSFTC